MPRVHEGGAVTHVPKRTTRWMDLKPSLETLDRKGLLALLKDLYDLGAPNRRFLHARFLSPSSALTDCHRRVAESVYPDPFSRRPISLRDANTAIAEYRRSTGDLAGCVDLMITFVEAGTAQALDLGFGDETYFASLEHKLNVIAKSLPVLSPDQRAAAMARLARLHERAAGKIGWGYGDYVDDVVTKMLSSDTE